MKKALVLSFVLCLFVAVTSNVFAEASYPTTADDLLFKNFICKLIRNDEIEITETSFTTRQDISLKNGKTIVCQYNPTPYICFEIEYANKEAIRYTVFVKSDSDYYADTLMAFARTFINYKLDDAKETLLQLFQLLENDEDANDISMSSLERDGFNIQLCIDNIYSTLSVFQ